MTCSPRRVQLSSSTYISYILRIVARNIIILSLYFHLVSVVIINQIQYRLSWLATT
ncbi:uncharacterized protein LACBIDRAFT_309383 [Laccaria bicolor S238N-H82]|uniref:Predicted protein n=1 Tax=Laccaria bicolor (strain S238N-H82 / ATCC MYA-4686) TaxID=486041 RepID=B0DS69_LACBS|nr:uncharacterized protein LACBIDRAFT_309383 [Laccaria bicolor S238N-H82]EDR02498.1 predicted protein [Laccaria bicolor S238N-H82]|eukprot:XP_001886861.1 predicted protein [Laccaria bicolor S238N-H82]